MENLWKEADLSSIEIKRIHVERSFPNFNEYWEIYSNCYKAIFDNLDLDTAEEIKTAVQKKLEAQSTDGKIVIRGHVNAIKGIVWINE